MASTTSARAFRVRGLECDTSIDQLLAAIECEKQSSSKRRILLKTVAPSTKQAAKLERPVCSLARQDKLATATVLCASTHTKTQAMNKVACEVKGVDIDCRFDGLTVLQAAEAAHIE